MTSAPPCLPAAALYERLSLQPLAAPASDRLRLLHSSQWTPLMAAAVCGRHEALDLLIVAGADLDATPCRRCHGTPAADPSYAVWADGAALGLPLRARWASHCWASTAGSQSASTGASTSPSSLGPCGSRCPSPSPAAARADLACLNLPLGSPSRDSGCCARVPIRARRTATETRRCRTQCAAARPRASPCSTAGASLSKALILYADLQPPRRDPHQSRRCPCCSWR